MGDTCGDNRFELIEKYKQKLLDVTNIEDSPEEMAVIDNILFRFWQMGWLDQLDNISRQPWWIPSECGENVPEVGDAVLVTFKDSDGKADVYIARWGGNFYDCGYYCLSVSEVLAWMPLPEPWKGGQE